MSGSFVYKHKHIKKKLKQERIYQELLRKKKPLYMKNL